MRACRAVIHNSSEKGRSLFCQISASAKVLRLGLEYKISHFSATAYLQQGAFTDAFGSTSVCLVFFLTQHRLVRHSGRLSVRRVHNGSFRTQICARFSLHPLRAGVAIGGNGGTHRHPRVQPEHAKHNLLWQDAAGIWHRHCGGLGQDLHERGMRQAS